MEAAAESRWYDAAAIEMGRPKAALGCAYLLGYVAECTLKAALGRIVGLADTDDLFVGAIRNVPNSGRHDARALLEACLQERTPRSGIVAVLDVGEWNRHVGNVADNTDVAFRYRSLAIAWADVVPLYDDVNWIFAHAPELWT